MNHNLFLIYICIVTLVSICLMAFHDRKYDKKCKFLGGEVVNYGNHYECQIKGKPMGVK